MRHKLPMLQQGLRPGKPGVSPGSDCYCKRLYDLFVSCQKPNGFTLLELVISVAILAFISIVISQSFFVTTRSNTKVEIAKEVKQNGDYAKEIMERMVRSAQTVTSSCTQSGAVSPTLTIVNPDSGITTFGCDSATGVTRIASTSGSSTVYLTSTSVSLGSSCGVSLFTFTCTTVAGIPNNVRLSFTLSQNNSSPDPAQKSTLSFQTSVTLRR